MCVIREKTSSAIPEPEPETQDGLSMAGGRNGDINKWHSPLLAATGVKLEVFFLNVWHRP